MAVVIPIVSEFDGKGIKRAVAEFQALEGAGAKAQFALKKAALPAAAALGALGAALGDATKAAMEDAQAQTKLATSLQNTTGASQSQIASAENYIATLSRASGIADDQLRPALAALAAGTKDVAQAQNTLGLAMDIAQGTGMDLTTVSEALAKAFQGNMKGLRSLSPEMASMIKEGATLEEVFNVLGGTYGGLVAANAETAAGKMQVLSNSLNEAKESIGAALLPAVDAILPKLQAFADWAQANPGTFITIAKVIGGIAAAIIALNIATKAWAAATQVATAVQWLFNAAMTANPVGLIVVGITALIAALVLAWHKVDWFREGVTAAFSWVKERVQITLDGFVAFKDALVNVFGVVKGAVTKSLDVIRSLFEAYLNGYKFIFNGIAKLWNNTVGKLRFSIPDWVPGLGGKGFDVPNIPMLGDGGVVTRPTLALIGERGPEAVVPLDRAGGMGGGINITIYSTIADETLPDKLVAALRTYNRTTGPVRIQVA